MTDEIGYSVNSTDLTREMQDALGTAEPSYGYPGFVGRIKRDWRNCPRAQQAALLGGNPDFQAWIGAADKNEAAEIIRTRCDVESRKELDSIQAAAERFDVLSRDYFRRFDLQSLEASMRDGPGYELASEPELPARPLIRPSRKRVFLMTVMALGQTPMGKQMSDLLRPDGRGYSNSYGVKITRAEARKLRDGGLIQRIDDPADDLLIITDLGRDWLQSYWDR